VLGGSCVVVPVFNEGRATYREVSTSRPMRTKQAITSEQVLLSCLKKTRTLIYDAKLRYQVLVLRLRDRLDDDADVIQHALSGCVAQDAVEGVDLSDLARVVIACGKCG
jgi:hypothetical protein